MIKESYIIPIFVVVLWIFNQVTIGNAQYAYNPYHMAHYVDFQVDQGHVYHHYQPKTIVDPKNPLCKITCRSMFCEVTKGEMQGQITGSCFFPPFLTTCGGLPRGCGSCVEACGFKDNTKEIVSVSSAATIVVDPKKKGLARSICKQMGGKLFIPESQLMIKQIDLIAKRKKFYFICEKM